MRSVLVALLVTIGISSARADIVYRIAMEQHSLFGLDEAQVVGTIITDGTIGALTPQNIVGGQYSETITDTASMNVLWTTLYSPVGSSWTPGSFTATDSTLTFDYGSQFANVLNLPDVFYTNEGPCCGLRRISSLTQDFVPRINIIAFGGQPDPASVPAPILGAGLPGLLLAGLLGWWRRKRA